MVIGTPDWVSGLVSALRDNIRLVVAKREKSHLRRCETGQAACGPEIPEPTSLVTGGHANGRPLDVGSTLELRIHNVQMRSVVQLVAVCRIADSKSRGIVAEIAFCAPPNVEAAVAASHFACRCRLRSGAVACRDALSLDRVVEPEMLPGRPGPVPARTRCCPSRVWAHCPPSRSRGPSPPGTVRTAAGRRLPASAP